MVIVVSSAICGFLFESGGFRLKPEATHRSISTREPKPDAEKMNDGWRR
jgi:hypothetical protein